MDASRLFLVGFFVPDGFVTWLLEQSQEAEGGGEERRHSMVSSLRNANVFDLAIIGSTACAVLLILRLAAVRGGMHANRIDAGSVLASSLALAGAILVGQDLSADQD
jgi:hypothetical protein